MCRRTQPANILGNRVEVACTTPWKEGLDAEHVLHQLWLGSSCALLYENSLPARPATPITFITSKGNHLFPAGIQQVYPQRREALAGNTIQRQAGNAD